MFGIRVRDTLDTWPSLTATVQLCPWQWRLRLWNDFDCSPSFTIHLGPLSLDLSANDSPFPLERGPLDDDKPTTQFGFR